MSTVPIYKILANFETSLASKITSSASSLTLDRSTDKEGTTLSGTYLLTIDEGTSSEEHMAVTLAGSAGTITRRGLNRTDGFTEVTANKFEHRRGASVKVTTFDLIHIARLLNGDDTFNGVSWTGVTSISGLSTPTAGETTKAANVAYVNAVAIAGASDASTTTKGIVEIATDAELQAGTGTGGTGALLAAVGSSFSQTPTANKVPVAKSSGKLDDGWIALTTAGDMVYSDGTDLQRLAVGTSSQVLKGGSAPTWGTVAPTELTGVNGTVSATALNTITAGPTSDASAYHKHPQTRGSNYTTHDISSVTDKTITHGMGGTPKFIRLDCTIYNGTTVSHSTGVWDGTDQRMVPLTNINDSTANTGSNALIGRLTTAASAYTDMTISAVGATTFTISFSKTGSPTGTIQIIWYAELI